MGHWEVIDVDELVADSENPRFDPVTTEGEAFLSILLDQQTKGRNKLLTLAQSIADDGLNPSEELVVSPIGDSGSFLVREGNRRVTAMKLSLHPELLPAEFASLYNGFDSLSSAMNSRRRIRCYVSDDETEIRRIMQLRHGGENGGAGLVKWNAEQQTRFSLGGNAQSRRAVSLVDDLELRLGNCEITRTAAAIPSTNLGRLISTPEVRRAVGVEVEGDEAHYVGGHDAVLLDVLRTVEAVGLASINRKNDRVALVKEAAARLEPCAEKENNEEQLVIQGMLAGKAEVSKGRTMADASSQRSGVSHTDEGYASEDAFSLAESNVVDSSEAAEAGEASSVEPSVPNEKKRVSKRRKPTANRSRVPLFGKVLRLRGAQSNDIYRAICWMDKQYLANPNDMSHLLPIFGFSLRLLLETAAREYYGAQNPPVDYGDNSLKAFLNEAKPYLKTKLDSGAINYLSLAAEWVNGSNNLNGILSKWAHGTMNVDRGALVQQSQLIAAIIEELWT